jgi:prepilin-type N-terminal cleavage/methylation domain-containing protein
MNTRKNLVLGFTLIELLVVISIIGLISSVILASLSSAREKARVARARNEMRQIVQAIIIAQGEQGRPLIIFAPNANCVQCVCAADPADAVCIAKIRTALTEIQNATNGAVQGLPNLAVNPWGKAYSIDGNQGEAGDCNRIDTIWAYGGTVPNTPVIPQSPICP